MFFLSPDETLAALTAAFLGGALFGRIVWRRQAYEGRIRTAADALLRRAEDQFRLVHDASPECVALLHPVTDDEGQPDFQFVYLNAASEQFTGRKPKPLIGRYLSKTLRREIDASLLRSLAGLTESGQSFRDEVEVDIGGGKKWVALTAVRIDDAIAVTLADVTSRKQAETMLAASNAELERRVVERTMELADARERYRLLAEHASDMISTHALDGTYTYAAPALESLLGCTTEELRGKSSLDFAAPDDKQFSWMAGSARGAPRARRSSPGAAVAPT